MHQVLAPARLSPEFQAWNQTWGAPCGRRIRPWRLTRHARLLGIRVIGPFSFQGNSLTRAFEYPWVHSELGASGGKRILEIGGALSGLQFVLSKEGAEVHNVDPLLDYGSGPYRSNVVDRHRRINRFYGSDVRLHTTALTDCHDLPGDFDAVYSVSTIEHMDAKAIGSTLALVSSMVKPGGLVVLTTDLFLDVIPFSDQQRNQYGSNISIAWIQSLLGFELISGVRAQLYGYDEFNAADVERDLESFMANGPQLAQAVAFRRPVDDAP